MIWGAGGFFFLFGFLSGFAALASRKRVELGR
jgi:hypothetical protein